MKKWNSRPVLVLVAAATAGTFFSADAFGTVRRPTRLHNPLANSRPRSLTCSSNPGTRPGDLIATEQGNVVRFSFEGHDDHIDCRQSSLLTRAARRLGLLNPTQVRQHNEDQPAQAQAPAQPQANPNPGAQAAAQSEDGQKPRGDVLVDESVQLNPTNAPEFNEASVQAKPSYLPEGYHNSNGVEPRVISEGRSPFTNENRETEVKPSERPSEVADARESSQGKPPESDSAQERNPDVKPTSSAYSDRSPERRAPEFDIRPSDGGSDSMSFQEFRAAFFGAGAELRGSGSSAAMVLGGRIFQACLDMAPDFGVEIARNSESVGFQIRDPHSIVRNCQRTYREHGLNCNSRPCVSLDSLPGGNHSMASEGDVTPRFCWQDANQSLSPTQCQDFSPALPRFVSAATQEQEREHIQDAVREAREAALRQYLPEVLQSCTSTREDLVIARRAADELRGLGAFSTELDSRLHESELAVLTDEVRTARTASEVTSASDRLLSFARNLNRGQSCDNLRESFTGLATRLVEAENSRENIDRATRMIESASALRCMNATSRGMFASNLAELGINRCRTALRSGNASFSADFGSSCHELLSGQGRLVTGACVGTNVTAEGCHAVSRAIEALRADFRGFQQNQTIMPMAHAQIGLNLNNGMQIPNGQVMLPNGQIVANPALQNGQIAVMNPQIAMQQAALQAQMQNQILLQQQQQQLQLQTPWLANRYPTGPVFYPQTTGPVYQYPQVMVPQAPIMQPIYTVPTYQVPMQMPQQWQMQSNPGFVILNNNGGNSVMNTGVYQYNMAFNPFVQGSMANLSFGGGNNAMLQGGGIQTGGIASGGLSLPIPSIQAGIRIGI